VRERSKRRPRMLPRHRAAHRLGTPTVLSVAGQVSGPRQLGMARVPSSRTNGAVLTASRHQEHGFWADRRALPVQSDCAHCGECLPMHPVVVTAQQQIDRRPARGRRHDDDDRWPGWAAAGTISPAQGRTPVDQVLGVGPPSAAWWSAHPGGVAAREQRRHKLSVASATDAGQGHNSPKRRPNDPGRPGGPCGPEIHLISRLWSLHLSVGQPSSRLGVLSAAALPSCGVGAPSPCKQGYAR